MRTPKLFNLVIVAALMLANVACACASVAPTADAAVHQHSAMQESSEHAPCHHQDCNGCGELLDSCGTPEYSVESSDRANRLAAPNQSAFDAPELEPAFIDTGQPSAIPSTHTLHGRYLTTLSRRANTPIQRKDQLTE